MRHHPQKSVATYFVRTTFLLPPTQQLLGDANGPLGSLPPDILRNDYNRYLQSRNIDLH
jgi:hypothetical protein